MILWLNSLFNVSHVVTFSRICESLGCLKTLLCLFHQHQDIFFIQLWKISLSYDPSYNLQSRHKPRIFTHLFSIAQNFCLVQTFAWFAVVPHDLIFPSCLCIALPFYTSGFLEATVVSSGLISLIDGEWHEQSFCSPTRLQCCPLLGRWLKYCSVQPLHSVKWCVAARTRLIAFNLQLWLKARE